MTPPLSPVQESVLREFAKPGTNAYFVSGRTYRIGTRHFPDTIFTLIRFGLVSSGFVVWISEAGRAALAAIDAAKERK